MSDSWGRDNLQQWSTFDLYVCKGGVQIFCNKWVSMWCSCTNICLLQHTKGGSRFFASWAFSIVLCPHIIAKSCPSLTGGPDFLHNNSDHQRQHVQLNANQTNISSVPAATLCKFFSSHWNSLLGNIVLEVWLSWYVSHQWHQSHQGTDICLESSLHIPSAALQKATQQIAAASVQHICPSGSQQSHGNKTLSLQTFHWGAHTFCDVQQNVTASKFDPVDALRVYHVLQTTHILLQRHPIKFNWQIKHFCTYQLPHETGVQLSPRVFGLYLVTCERTPSIEHVCSSPNCPRNLLALVFHPCTWIHIDPCGFTSIVTKCRSRSMPPPHFSCEICVSIHTIVASNSLLLSSWLSALSDFSSSSWNVSCRAKIVEINKFSSNWASPLAAITVTWSWYEMLRNTESVLFSVMHIDTTKRRTTQNSVLSSEKRIAPWWGLCLWCGCGHMPKCQIHQCFV